MLKNKKLLIIGGSSEIGHSFIKNYAPKFLCVISTFNLSKKFNRKYKNVIYYKINLKKINELKKFTKYLKLNQIYPDIIINLAAPKLKFSRFEETNYEYYKLNFDVQLRPFYEIIKFSIINMKKNNYGKIICLLSSSISDLPSYMNSYITSKFSLLGFMSGLSSEYKKYNINFICLSPSMVKTKFISEIPKSFIELSNYNKKLLKPNNVSVKIYSLILKNNKKKLNFFI